MLLYGAETVTPVETNILEFERLAVISAPSRPMAVPNSVKPMQLTLQQHPRFKEVTAPTARYAREVWQATVSLDPSAMITSSIGQFWMAHACGL